MRFFLASSTPLRMDSGTSPALPSPAPTWPAPSPTTTTALKLKRRPPLTTLATRLIWTTRSSSVSLVGSMRAIRSPLGALEVEAGLAGGLGQGTDPPVVAVAGPIEDDLLDPGGLGPRGQQPSDGLGPLHLAAGGPPQLLLHRRGGRHGVAPTVVDDLGVDVIEAAEDGQPRARRSPGHREADPGVALAPRGG